MNSVYLKLISVASAVVFLILLDFLFEFILNKSMKNKKKSLKVRVLLRYVLFSIFLFIMAKIWMEGFGFLLTFIGIISAAFTITQKEYLMNLVGWLIIMWRDLFSEGDYVEIGKYSGFIRNIRPFYFSLYETSDVAWGEKTGKIYKIPNSIIATHSIVNFSIEKTFFEGKVDFIFTFDSSIEKIQSACEAVEESLEEFYLTQYKEWSTRQKKDFNSLKSASANQPQYKLRVFQDRPSGILLKVRYYSMKQDRHLLEDLIFEKIIEIQRKNKKDITFAVAT